MSAKFTVRLASEIANHPLPPRLMLAQQPLEPFAHVLLKLLAAVIFSRDRLQMETRLEDDNIPFVPDLAQLDYEMRPVLWIECGETPAARLDKLAVKVPLAEIWIVQRSADELGVVQHEMERQHLRRNRYCLLAFDAALFDELLALLTNRNELTLFRLNLEEGQMQFDFNGVWFDAELVVTKF